MIYTVDDIKAKVKSIAEQYDIVELRLFGSYYNGAPTDDSDVDLIVKYGPSCCGFNRIQFMNELEAHLGKRVDVVNADFLPDFLRSSPLNDTANIIYNRQ